MRILMVAEKPSIAIAIARILAKGQLSSSKGRATSIHEWEGNFRGQKATFLMTSVLGHVFRLDFPDTLGWGKIDPRDIFTATPSSMEANPEQHVVQHLAQVAKGCSHLILWLDCDREGENIGFEVMSICEPKMLPKHEVFRAKFSAITAPDVSKAMANLGRPNQNESLSVDARREIDLKVGVAFSRYQTTTFHFRYANLDAHLISYGPCQTPTLGFCVDRYDEIQKFRPTPYFKLVAHILRMGVKTKLKWSRPRIMKERSGCVNYQNRIAEKGGAWATVTDVKNSKSKQARPIPLNTVALMKAASTLLNIGPQQCMHIAEHLYISGWISYPRTESSSYPEHFDVHEVVEQHVKHPEWGKVAQQILTTGLQRAKKGVDHGDHPPITPTACAVRDRDLSGAEWRVYEYIACHFIATVCNDAVFENQAILYDIGGESFSSSGSALVEPGFLEVMPWARPGDKYMATVKIGEQFQVDSIGIKEGVTKAPGFISESELIGLMEKFGIGTDASIPTHIENIQKSYVKLHERTRTLEPNKLGIALVHGYHRIDPELVLPKVRANIETMVSKIALGQASYDVVLKTSLDIFLTKYDAFVASIAKMDELFEASFASLGSVQVNTRLKPKCGKCDRYMKYIDSKPHRLYCVNCEEVYSMPKDGSLKSDSLEGTCPLDGFKLVVHTDRRGRATRLCPKCYNTPDFPDMKPNSNCAQCPNKACAFNLAQSTFEQNCPSCDLGFLSLEPINGRRIDCNLCPYHIELPMDANKISLSPKQCENCPTKPSLIIFKYSANSTPHPTKSVEFAACIRCDSTMKPLMKVKLPGAREPRTFGGRGGRGDRHGTLPIQASSAPGSGPNTAATSSTGGSSKKADSQFYNMAAVAALLGKPKSSATAAQEPEDDYMDDYEMEGRRGRRGRNQQQPSMRPRDHTVSLMDMVTIHKTKAKPAQGQTQAAAGKEEWQAFNPEDLVDVVTTVSITPPAAPPSQDPPQHRNQHSQGNRQGEHQPRTNQKQNNRQQNQGPRQSHGQQKGTTEAHTQQNRHHQPLRQDQAKQGEQEKPREPRAKSSQARQPGADPRAPGQSNKANQQKSNQPKDKAQNQQRNQGATQGTKAPAMEKQGQHPSQTQTPLETQPQKPRQQPKKSISTVASAPAYVPKAEAAAPSAQATPAQTSQTASSQPSQTKPKPKPHPNHSSKPQGKAGGSKAPQYAPKANQS
jgi:DNA topoisomerase-3